MNKSDNYPQAERQFIANQAMRGLSNPRLLTADKASVQFADIVHYVGGVYQSGDTAERVAIQERIRRGILNDLSLRRQYRQVLAACQVVAMPRAAAADDGSDMAQRQGPGFVLKFLRSKRESSQYYVVLEVDALLAGQEATQSQAGLVAHITGKDLLCLTFPPLEGGKTQCLLQADDPLLAALRCGDNEIILVADEQAGQE